VNDDSKQESSEQVNPKALVAMAVAMIFGIALGVTLGVALDNMAFLGVGIACGTAIGLSLSSVLQTRGDQDES